MVPDPIWCYIGIGIGLLLLGGFLAAIITPVGVVLRGIWFGLLRVTRIRRSAGHESVQETQILALVDAGEEDGAIQSDEREMIENIFAFNDIVAEDVMIHRTDMTLIWLEDSHAEITDIIVQSGRSRFPVYGEDTDDILGILSTRDYLLNREQPQPKPLKDLLRPAYFVPVSVAADVLFRDMQQRKTHMALVVDEYGGIAGLVTMEDLIEEILGNIYDEFDPQEERDIIPLGDNLWRIAGSAELDDVAEALDMTFDEEVEADTLGGLVFDQLSVIPEDGSQAKVETCGLMIEVENFNERRVEWAKVSKTIEEML